MTNNPTFDEAFALELSSLASEPRLVPVPVPGAALGYGTDLSCTNDCTDNFDEVDPFSQRALAEALIRRLMTRRGALLDDQNYGLGIYLWLNHAATPRDLQSYSDQVVGECSKDDRCPTGNTCSVSFDLATGRLGFVLRIDPVDPRTGTFTLTFAVTPDGEALIESIV